LGDTEIFDFRMRRRSEKEVEKSKSLKKKKGLEFFISNAGFGKRRFRRKEGEQTAKYMFTPKQLTP